MEKPAREKLSHAAVQYVDSSPHVEENCGVCAHFIKATPPRCEGVQSPVRVAGYCQRFQRRSRIGEAMKNGK